MNRIGDTLHHFGPNKELVRALISHQVEFVVIGGLAVSWFCPDRQADDMDLLVNPSKENAARLVSALGELRISGFSERSFLKPGVHAPLKQHQYADLLTPHKNGLTYAQVAESAVDAKLFDIPVRLASPQVLIRLKEHAVASAEAEKQKHLTDIERLKRHAA